MKINLNKSLLSLDNAELPEKMGNVIASILISSSKGNSIKCYEQALKLNKGEDLELDSSDFDSLYKLVEESANIINLAKAQILLEMKKQKDNEKE